MAADHIFELDADVLTLASELEGHPDNVAAALHGGFVICADGHATRFDVPAGLEAVLVAVELALASAPPSGRVSIEHVLNVLARLNAAPLPENASTTLQLNTPPRADTARYDKLRSTRQHETQEADHA